jgi:hypothetical protein
MIDKDKALALAKEMGIKVTFDSPEPGVIVGGYGRKVNFYTFEEFFTQKMFPELEYREENKYDC